MGELGALFNPGMRHELAERKAKALRREEEGNAGDGDLRIDLESGTATINIPAPGEHVADADTDSGMVDPDDEDLGQQDPDDVDATDALTRDDERPEVGGSRDEDQAAPAAAPGPRVTGKSGRRRSA